MYLSIVSTQYPSTSFILYFLQICQLPHEFTIADLECYLLYWFVLKGLRVQQLPREFMIADLECYLLDWFV
ncbi:hypothetical protein H5410_032899 [Solanum commersonii]|uniref:Uncharacterized protein n=1 Tax=Solanum commersonii TaxID=4109 RepID=A0A9J5YMA6_SOLCO|nr:hypothetical protein H5410_032899 [Solanum commersonii]